MCDKPHIVLHSSHVQRQQLDRRRLETAHLKYASLTLAQHYPEVTKLSSVSVGAEITDSLLEIAPALFNAFKQKYTGMEILYLILHALSDHCYYSAHFVTTVNTFMYTVLFQLILVPILGVEKF